MSRKDIDDKFEKTDFSNLTAEEKIKKYLSIYSGCEEWMDSEKIYEWYVESGKIIPSMNFKKEIFKSICTSYKSELDKRISDVKYHKFGNYYQIDVPTDTPYYNKYNESFVDEQGNFIKKESFNFQPFRDEKIEIDSDINMLLDYLPKEKINVLSEQIKQIARDFETAYPNTKFDSCYSELSICGNILEIELNSSYYNMNNIIFIKSYIIKADGTLEEIEPR